MALVKITCPSCDASFKVKAEALQPEGRKVKCARCAHKWFQEPVEDADAAEKPAPKKRKRKKKPAADEGEAAAPAPKKRRRVKKKTAPPPPPPEEEEMEEEAADDGYDEAAGYDSAASAAADAAAAPSGGDDMAPIPPLMEKPPKKSMLTTKNAMRVLWGLLVTMVVASIISFFVFADALKDQFPDLEGVYQLVGLAPAEGGKRLDIKNIATDMVFDRDQKVMVLEVKADIINPNADRIKEIPPLLIILENSDGVRVSSWTHRMANPSIGKAAVVEMVTRKANPHSEARRVRIEFQPGLPNEPGE